MPAKTIGNHGNHSRQARAEKIPLVVDRHALTRGLTLTLFFVAVLYGYLVFHWQGNPVMREVDSLFSSLSKGSTYYIPKLFRQTENFIGVNFDVAWQLPNQSVGDSAVAMLSDMGFGGSISNDQLLISGDLGVLATAALADADAAYHSGEQALILHGLESKRALYTWWLIFKQLEGELRANGRTEDARFVKAVMTGALEPAYNYNGIEAKQVREQPSLTIGLLLFYLFYTIIWGNAATYLLQAVGITTKAGKKQEV